MARFRDIPQLTRSASYMVNVGLGELPRHYAHYILEYRLDVSPDFQRMYVWREEQKVRFMEYMLRGGTSGLDIYINSPHWRSARVHDDDWMVLVDGKQRLDAALGFLNNEFPVFGSYLRDFEDRPSLLRSNFRWHVNDSATRAEVLQWYLDLNSGGTVHTQDELTKVRQLLADGGSFEGTSQETIREHANLGREALAEALAEIAEEHRKQDAYDAAKARGEIVLPKPKKSGTKRTGRSP